MKVCFDTYGCRLNRAEALEEEAKYIAAGYELTDEYKDADIIVVRGCSITERAQKKCEKVIEKLRNRYPAKKLIVQGCVRQEIKTSEKQTGPGVVKQKPIRVKNDSGHGYHIIKERDDLPIVDMLHWRVPIRTSRAYLKVQNGCNGKCTFCIVPQFRGKSVSEDFDEVIAKAQGFIDSGYHEIVVTGCNLSLYASKGKKLADLVAALAELDANCRIRIGSIEPGEAALELVKTMAEHPNVCRFLHLPIQSGSEMVLKAMNRPYSVKETVSLLETSLKLMPNLALGCDLMAGFPGEGEIAFVATKGLLQRFPFTNVHVFPYSERPGTPAENFLESVPKNMRSLWAHELADIANRKRKIYAHRFLGKEVEIVVEDIKTCGGWSDEYLWCSIGKGAAQRYGIERKQLLKLRVKSVSGDRLLCVPVKIENDYENK